MLSSVTMVNIPVHNEHPNCNRYWSAKSIHWYSRVNGFSKGAVLISPNNMAKQFCFSLSSIAFIRLSIGSLKVNFWGQRANRLPAVAMFHIESRGRSRRVLKKCDRQGGHRTKGRKDEVGRGGLSSTPPRALVIFYPPHPNLSKTNKQQRLSVQCQFFFGPTFSVV